MQKKKDMEIRKNGKKPKEKVRGMASVWISEYKINKKVLREQVSIAICIQGRYRGAGRCKMLGVLMTLFGVAPSFNVEVLGVLNDNIL